MKYKFGIVRLYDKYDEQRNAIDVHIYQWKPKLVKQTAY